MALFKRKTTLESLEQQRIALAVKLNAAEAAVIMGARDASRGDNSDAEARAAAAVTNAQNLVRARIGALADVDAELADLREKQRLEADRAKRVALAGDLTIRAEALEALAIPAGDIFRKLHAAASDAQPVTGEIGLPGIAMRMADEIPQACQTIAAELRARAAQILDGSAPAFLPKAPTLEVLETVQPEAHIRIFSRNMCDTGTPAATRF
jgi:hypothetical protein